MKTTIVRALAVALMLAIAAPEGWATCGGGGGGGVGGMSPGSGGGAGMPEQVYYVPWKVLQANEAARTEGLVLYWFPSSPEELQRSSLRVSRELALYASQCVAMQVAGVSTPPGQKFVADSKLPVAVLATADGKLVGKLENTNGRLNIGDVEKLLGSEMKKREDALSEQLKDGKSRAKSGDSAGAISALRTVYEQKCLFPKKAKDAAKELKKLGVNDVAEVPDAPIFEAKASARIEETMRRGLAAEMAAKYGDAEKLYGEAHRMDPADPAPLRYLGEVYRHETGEWDKARTTFEAILAMPADPLSRAVALHGLGKMTIHEGDFAKGLSLMESSVKEYPLALAYRNLAVYWNSEGDTAKADQYTREALALDPKDPFNLIFAAAFLAGNGHGNEALKIARENEALLEASYNLAAIYAQMGQRDKALTLLKRHFFEYERYQSVRAKEMMEARVDAVFASLRSDADFIALTSGADGKLPVPEAMSSQPRSAQ
jgi:tetratricopeptide (TPR) repeat protein